VVCDAQYALQPCYGYTGQQVMDGMHKYFTVFHSGINVGNEVGYIIAIGVFFKLLHSAVFIMKAQEAKTVKLPAA